MQHHRVPQFPLSLRDVSVAIYSPSVSASRPDCLVHPIPGGQAPRILVVGMLWWGYPLPQPHWRSGVGSGWNPAPPQTQLYRLGRRQPPVRSLRVPPPLPAFIPGQAWQVPVSSQPPRPAVRLRLHLSLPFPSQPFWPLGTGVARGFLAAFDAAWMVRRWAAGTPPLEVLAER